jgi:kumamolisin
VKGSDREPLPGARAIGPANPHTHLEVTLKLRRAQPLPSLDRRPDQPMTREELAARHGASQEDTQKVAQALAQFDLTVVDVNLATRTVRIHGSIENLENAFQVRLLNYVHERGNYRGRVGCVHVPEELDGIVQGVFGLDTRRTVRRRRHPARDLPRTASASAIPSSWYTPAELAQHYNFPAGDGAGQCVAVLEFGGGYFEADLAQFCALAGVDPPAVKVISIDGTPTDVHDGQEGEVMLDIEVIAGVCPKASQIVYFAQFTEQGWLAALDAILQDKQNDPSVISCSWGWAEDETVWTGAAMTQVNEALQEAALLGITVCVASGDDGSSDAITDGHAHADFPGSSPFVVCVGGTTIPKKGVAGADIVWKEGEGLRTENGGSTGGGVSAIFPRPAWQAAIGIKSVNPGAIAGRVVPDIAMNADWNASPYLLVVDGQPQGNGGTSAAAPLFASLVALMNQQRGAGKRVGYLTPVLYQAHAGSTVGGTACNDVTSGNNKTDKLGGYHAGKGFDATSGWGSPNGKILLALLP